jgi:hypothetical protein
LEWKSRCKKTISAYKIQSREEVPREKRKKKVIKKKIARIIKFKTEENIIVKTVFSSPRGKRLGDDKE